MTLLGNRYELGEPLGRGGMADVRRARDTRLNRDVAVKRLRADLAADATFQARFRREAQAAAGLNHPNIVAVYDTGEDYDEAAGVTIPYIVMELVEGQTLRDVLRDGRKILPERACEIMLGVLEALNYSHKAGIVHRDIKPANVMLTAAGTIKVMDFGIARAVADASSTMTQTAAVIGTAQYLSPEQARGETVDRRSDIYSAGCLFYELLTGRPPFVGDSPVSVAYQHVREQPAPPSQLDPMITEPIDAIVLTALAKDPDARYQTAREMSDDVRRLLQGQEVTTVLPRAGAVDDPTVVAAAVAPTAAMNPVQPVSAPTPAAADTGELVLDELADDEEEEPRRRVWPWVLVGVLAVLAIAAAVGIGSFLMRPPAGDGASASPTVSDTPTPTPTVAMLDLPDTVGLTEDVAKDRLDSFEVKVKEERGKDDQSVGEVIKQDPAGGGSAQAEEGSTVTITINIGPNKVEIPTSVIGQQSDDAVKALVKLGFDEENIDVQESPGGEPVTAKKGEVIAVSPESGSEVTLDTDITLTVATGTSSVPNWQGQTKSQVESEAKNLGFSDVEFAYEETDQADEDTVLRTEPAAGESVERSAKLRVILAKAPPATPDPTESSTPDPTTSPS